MSLLKRKSAVTLISLVCLTAACICLNILGIRLNGIWGTPLFLDNVGTLLAALLGGYIPCITVGFLTNILVGIGDSYTTYYCIISVFIAAAAVILSERKMLTRFPHVLLSAVVFALIGGGIGGVLTWLIYGFSFGEGFAVDLAEKINSALPMGYFASNLLAAFLVDLADKAIVTAAALIISRLLPKRLKELLNAQSWRSLSVLRNRKKRPGGGVPVAVKVSLPVVLASTLVAVAASAVSILHYHNYSTEHYRMEGTETAAVIADTIDKTRVDEYLERGRSADGYAETEATLYALKRSSPEIRFIYVYRIEEDGTHVIFDVDTEDVKGEEPGAVIRYDGTIEKYLGDFLSGKDVPEDVTTDETGTLLTIYRAVRDSGGRALCYVGVDMSMNRLSSEEFAYLTRIISLFMGFLIVIMTYAVWMAECWISRPINAITEAAAGLGYDTPEARERSAETLEKLVIDTGDEIEDLSNAYKKTTFDTIHYINESEKKSKQITKLQNGLILVLADMVESRDKCTGDHVRKTAAYADIILRQMQKDGIYADRITEDFITEVVCSAPLHDVGKIKIPDSVLNKPGKLTDEEFSLMKSHTTAGGDIIDKAIDLVDEETEYLNEARNLASYHHEKWNGMGYPNGLSGEEIPLSARVMAVADVFDALVSRRSYKEPFSVDQALDIIRSDAGTHFDPNVVQAFLNAEDEVRRVAALNMEL